MAKKIFLSALIVFIHLLSVNVFAQNQLQSNYVLQNWGMSEGLPQSSVNDIIQTQDGYIWLATFGGLVRFDGDSFTTFNRSSNQELRSDRILNLFEDSSGAIWISTEDGFFQYKNDTFKEFVIVDENQVFSPSMISEDSRGVLWFVANQIPYQIKNDTLRKMDVIDDVDLKEKSNANQEGIMLAFGYKIVRTLGDSVIKTLDLTNTLTDNLSDALEFPAKSRNYFYGSHEDGVFYYKDGETLQYTVKDGLPSRYTWHFKIDRKNQVWVSSFEGLSLWNGNGFSPFSSFFDFDDSQIKSILEDKEGTYWLGTLNDGLFQLKPTYISTIDKQKGLQNEIMLSLSTLNDGRIIFATNCGGIYEWKDNKASHLTFNQHLPNLCIWSVFQDSKNRIWFGSRTLYRSNSLEKPGILVDNSSGFDGYDVFAITEDRKGNIWIGCFNGIFIYDGNTYQSISVENGLSYNDTRVFFEDDDGSMWVGTSAGLNRIKDGIVTPFPLLNRNDRSEPYIRAIHKDKDGTYWIGSYGNGLFRIKNDEVSNITPKDGLFDNIVSHLVEDQLGNLWSGSNRGIFRMKKNELNEFLDGKIDQIHTQSFGIEDGMKSAETNGGFQPNVIQDANGLLYFPTVAGVSVLNPNKLPPELDNPLVYIEALQIDNISTEFSNTIEVSYKHSYIEIEYTAISFREPEKLNFSYRLSGINDKWLNAGKQRSVIFTQLPPGNYTFSVTANTDNSTGNTNIATLQLVIVPPFWNTAWFYTLVSVLLFTLVYGSFYLRVHRLKKENEQQKRFTEQLMESQEHERRRIATELHDGLGQQILIIKNRAEIAGIVRNNDAELNIQLEEIKQSAISSIDDMRNIAHNLRPVHLERFGLSEALEYLCDEVRKTSAIEFSYRIDKIDGLIPQKQEINFYRIIQEGIQNIIKHADATEATLFIQIAVNVLKIQLWDDGVGFDVNKVNLFGIGFLGMNERVELLNGKFDIQSKPGIGTTLHIVIPIKDGK